MSFVLGLTKNAEILKWAIMVFQISPCLSGMCMALYSMIVPTNKTMNTVPSSGNLVIGIFFACGGMSVVGLAIALTTVLDTPTGFTGLQSSLIQVFATTNGNQYAEIFLWDRFSIIVSIFLWVSPL